MRAELVLDCRDIVGESIVWSADEQALYWVDIIGSRIHRLDPETGQHQMWPTPEYPTSIGLRLDGGFVVGLRHRVCTWTPDGAFETLAVPEPDLPGNRLNEGAVAPDGSFWVGTMQDNIGADGTPQDMTAHIGALYRIDPTGSVTRLTDMAFGITNTMIWTDRRTFVTADTLANQLYEFDWDGSATLSNPRPFGTPLSRGLPDGSTMDRRGAIYNARVAGGGAIARIAFETEASFVPLPCANPTSCTFGGKNLDTLFVTSSRFGMDDQQLNDAPYAGGLFAIPDLGTGSRSNRFG